MPIANVLRNGAVLRDSIVHLYAELRRKQRFMAAGRQSVYYFPQKDVRDTWWMDTAHTPECLGWRHRIKAFYMVTRDSSLSFPTPKLGPKSRVC